jgi:superfamily II DNA or RNA helicase
MGVVVQTNSNNRTLVQRLGRIVRYRENHRAVLFVLCTQGTQDESWVDDALKSIDPQRVMYIPEREIYSGEFLKYL